MRNPNTKYVRIVARGEGGGSGPPAYELTSAAYDLIRDRARVGSPVSEIADAMRVTSGWLSKLVEDSPVCDPEACEAYSEGLSELRAKLRGDQLNLAETNAQMAIFAGKQYLGQKDQQTIEVNKRIHVVGALPDYAQTPEDWQKIFAPRDVVQAIEAPPVEEAQIVESEE